jgi:heptosyltransferase III
VDLKQTSCIADVTDMPTLSDAIPPAHLSRVLVIKLGHLGDVLLASPVISVLKRHCPHSEIDALVYDDTATMLSGHTDLARLFTINRGPLGRMNRMRAEWQLLCGLRARRYDLLVCLSHKPRVAWIARFTGARYAVTADKPDRPKFWRKSFTHVYPVPRGNTRHTVELHLDALRRVGIFPSLDERRLTLVPGEEAERRIEGVLTRHGLRLRSFVHIHPGSRWLFKCWPAPRLASLINELHLRGERVVLTAAPDPGEEALIAAVTSRLNQPVINLAGTLSLKELAALVACAKIFIGVDSVPMHMASAMQTPVVVLFGPSGDIEWGPWQTTHRIVVSNHTCRPCGINGCGGSNRSECLEVIEVKQVLAAIDSVLEGTITPTHITSMIVTHGH